jgi:hypothetical protein
MRKVFLKHLPKIEATIRQDPINDSLWRIWAWMARSTPDYKRAVFFNSVDSFDFPNESIYSPPGDVCVWVVQDARARGDWETVIKYARRARSFTQDSTTREKSGEWSPSGGIFGDFAEEIDGYPLKSAYIPHLEALLRLGDIEEANVVYDEIIKAQLKSGVALVAEIAKSLKMEGLAEQWEKGELIDKTPFFHPYRGTGSYKSHILYVFAEPGSGFDKQFDEQSRQVAPRIWPIGVNSIYGESAWDNGIEQFGWKKEDGPRWALLTGDGRLLEQGTTIPGKDTIQIIYKRHNIVNSMDFFRLYLAEKGRNPGLELFLAYRINDHNFRTSPENENPALLDDNEDERLWGEAARLLRGVANNLDILSNPPHVLNLWSCDIAKLSALMKNLSGQYLTNVESLLIRKPSEEGRWRQWFYWRTIEGKERSMKPLLERIKPIPPSTLMELLPHEAIETYYEECRMTGNWLGVIEILKPIWEREIEWALESQAQPQGQNQEQGMEQIVAQTRREMAGRLADSVAAPLIEAFLNDGKSREAGEIFSKCLEAGLKFSDTSKLIKLAESLGHERLAKEWGRLSDGSRIKP